MLTRQRGRQGSGSQLNLTFKHHSKKRHLKESVTHLGYYICRVTLGKYNEKYDDLKTETDDDRQQQHQELEQEQEQEQERGHFLTVCLRPSGWQRQAAGLYHLDFKMEKVDLVISSFVLKQNDGNSYASIHARPISNTTADPAVMNLAKDWITECLECHGKCRPAGGKILSTCWYLSRLLDVETRLDPGGVEVLRLVSQKAGEKLPNQAAIEGSYVTLSHRWGTSKFVKLTNETLYVFLHGGLLLKDMPQVFQDAVKVTRALGQRWLWIDALCIMQDQTDLKESITMEKVYTNSYCNISATAALDSSFGLFNKRKMTYKWIENIRLNTKGLQRRGEGRAQEKVDCTIMDLSFWEWYVDNSPVNRRSWVYQERLLAPRVLHWCKGQIAFECREVSRSESRPEGLPHFRIKSNVLIDGVRLKSTDMEAGKRLRAVREASMRGMPISSKAIQKMVDEIEPRFHLYELWKHWVEVYTKMELTHSRDRLIVLSGIARMMSSRMEAEGIKDEEYIAGMWKNYLASQLLWFVNEAKGKDRQPFENTRPNGYRAPSFSWASVETARVVTFAESRDRQDPDLLVRIEVVRLSYRTKQDLFGLLTDGYLVLTGVLRKIELRDSFRPHSSSQPKKEEEGEEEKALGNRKLEATTETETTSLSPTLLPLILLYSFFIFLYSHLVVGTIRFWSATAEIAEATQAKDNGPNSKIRGGENPRTCKNADVDLNAKDTNRYSWRLVQNRKPVGRDYQIVYLDSPASEPSVFGPEAQAYCLPMLKEDRHLTCLLLQATDGDYGVRYKRVGLTKVSTMLPDLVSNLTTPPGHNKTELGRVYWGPGSRLKGESTICIG